MTKYLQIILEGKYSWVPIVLLVVTILVALYIGIRRRWSTSVFFFVINIGLWVSILLSFDNFYGYIVDWLNLKDYTDFFIAIQSSSIAIVMSLAIIGVNIFALIFIFPIFLGIRKLIYKRKEHKIKKRMYISLPISITTAFFAAPMIYAGTTALSVDQESITYKSPWLYEATNFVSVILSGNVLNNPHRIQTLISLGSMVEDANGDFNKTPLGRIFNVGDIFGANASQNANSFTLFDFQRIERVLVNKNIVTSLIKILNTKAPSPTTPITSAVILQNASRLYDLLGGNDSEHRIHIDPDSYEALENFLISNNYFADAASAGYYMSIVFDSNPIYR